MSLKLAMCFALAESTNPLLITPKHMADAQATVTRVSANALRLAENVHVTPETIPFHRVKLTIQRAGRITHSRLLRTVSKYSCTADKVKVAVRQLIEQDDVNLIRDAAGMTYEWIGAPPRRVVGG